MDINRMILPLLRLHRFFFRPSRGNESQGDVISSSLLFGLGRGFLLTVDKFSACNV